MIVAYNIVKGKGTLPQFTMANTVPLLSNSSAMLRYLNTGMYEYPIKRLLFPETILLSKSVLKDQYNIYTMVILSLLIFYLIIRDLYILLQEMLEEIFEWRIFIMRMIIYILEIQILVSLNYFLIGGTTQ